jgi:hypothetical protein
MVWMKMIVVESGAREAFMLTVLARLTLGKTKSLPFVVQCYSIHWNTAEPIR